MTRAGKVKDLGADTRARSSAPLAIVSIYADVPAITGTGDRNILLRQVFSTGLGGVFAELDFPCRVSVVRVGDRERPRFHPF